MSILKPPFTRQQIDAMHARDYDFVCKKWPEAVKLALAPPPPPPVPALPLFPRSDIKKIAVAEEMAAEYLAFAKKNNHVLGDGTIPEFVYELFLQSKNEAAQLKDAEAECERWVSEHETYDASESNRVALWNWLQEKELPLTYANLDKAFAALIQSGDTKALLPVADRTESRPGRFKNGIFEPFDPGNSQGMIKNHLVGLSRGDTSSRAEHYATVLTRKGDPVRLPKDQMTSDQFQYALNHDPKFREAVNKS
jgi:hypothetical protein